MKKMLFVLALLSSTLAHANQSCDGSGKITQSINVSKLFFVVHKNQKVAYSNQYGSKGTTKFETNGIPDGNVFDTQNFVVYHGVKDASGICVPNKLVISK